MKPSKKRSGLITIVVFALAITAYLIYQYGYIAYREYDYYTHYDDIHGLQRSSPVFIDGVRVGEVGNIELDGDNKVQVTLSIDKKVHVPKGSVAMLASSGLLGSTMIQLEQGKGPGIYTHKDVLTGMYDTSVMDMKEQIDPMIESAKYILGTADKYFSNFNRRIDNGLVEKTQKNILSIEKSMSSYKEQASSIRVSANDILDDIKKLRHQSDKMVAKIPQLDSNIENAEATTADLAGQPFAATTNSLRGSINNVRQQADKVENSATAKKALNNTGQYSDISNQLKDADTSMRSLRNNPPGFSLLGGN